MFFISLQYRKMKLLIIASDIGVTAPGIVYETLINQLAKDYEISIISPEISTGFKTSSIKILPSKPVGFTHLRVEKMSFEIFNRNILDDYWLLKQKLIINNDSIRCCDAVVSFVSFHNYRSLLLGNELSKKFNKPWIVYSVDAVPPPNGWGVEGSYRKNTIRFINKYIGRADMFFSANEQMLNYQLGLLQFRPSKVGVLYTPIKPVSHSVKNRCSREIPIFLYTGGLYGPRKKNAVLDGFRLLLKHVSKAKIVFVGIGKYEKFMEYQDLLENENLEYYDFRKDLTEFYQRATVLIDINAYFDNDVFLSSKIVNYLPIGLPIVSVTGLNSPSRNIFTDDMSIIHCQHDAKEVCEALQRALNVDVKKEERYKYIKMFSPENVLNDFNKALKTL